MVIYAIDLVILIFIGRVPLAYNLRNLRVRWPITLLTAVVFTAVVGILTVLLAFVNGMYQLTSDSGQPGNVLILADGSTDEVFSNLGYSDVALFERETATLDEDNRPLRRPIRAKRIARNGEPIPIASREVYCIINRPVENDPTRRQFVQVRGVVDPQMAGEVHGLRLVAGDWFADAGVRTPAGLQPGSDKDQIEAVSARAWRELGSKRGVPTLVVGDTFELADRTWVVAGIMNTEGTTFGSEVWAKHDRVSKMFNKLGYSSLVLRVEDDGSREEVAERARQFAAPPSASLQQSESQRPDRTRILQQAIREQQDVSLFHAGDRHRDVARRRFRRDEYDVRGRRSADQGYRRPAHHRL